MIRPEPPFSRTVCGCKQCQDCCRKQPGHLIPGDLERIAEYLGIGLEEAKSYFWDSPGAVVSDGVKMWRIRTITPKFLRKQKRCVFLSETGLCRIHSVAPFGCAYADTHMTAAAWHPRSVWAMRLIASEEYQALRKTLKVADSYKPTRL